MFTRIFLSTTGLVTVLSGIYLIVATIFALYNHRAPRAVNVAVTFTFLTAFVCHGVAWLLVALSKRLWK